MSTRSDPDAALTDEQILERVFSDPEKGWKEFFRKHQPFIRNLIYRYRLTHEDSEDLFQEVSLRLARNNCDLLRGWDSRRCSLKGYLAVITTSVCLNFLRSSFHKYAKRKVDPLEDGSLPVSLHEFINATPSPRERFERIEKMHLFTESLDDLLKEGKIGPIDRLLFECRLAGMTYHEIAELLGISMENAIQRFHRLKTTMKKRLEAIGVRELG